MLSYNYVVLFTGRLSLAWIGIASTPREWLTLLVAWSCFPHASDHDGWTRQFTIARIHCVVNLTGSDSQRGGRWENKNEKRLGWLSQKIALMSLDGKPSRMWKFVAEPPGSIWSFVKAKRSWKRSNVCTCTVCV